MNLLDITFENMLWIYLLVPLVGLFALLFYLGYRRRQAGIASFLSQSLRQSFTQQVSGNKRTIKKVLILLGAAILILAIARPQLGYYWEERPEETTDILFALDTSKSMLAPDIKPNRMFRAKLAIEELVSNLEGVRIGLIPFAGDAFLWCPLTYDREAFIDTLKGVDTKIIPVGGTNLLSAVETAERSFTDSSTTTKIMILITDGEDLSGQLDQKLPQIVKQGWTVHAVGIGTEEGELIPIVKEDGSTAYVTDEEGRVVKTKLDSETLKKIAEATHGSYQPLGPTGEGLRELFEKKIQPELQIREEKRLRKIPIERYGWFVAAALLLLVTELFLKDRKRIRNGSGAQSGVLPLVALLCLIGFPQHGDASIARDAQKSYDQENYENAETLYLQAVEKQPTKKEYSYNAGISAMNNGDFESAKNAFDAALTSDDVALQERSYYNRGNTQYFLGRQILDTAPQETVKYWEQAIKDYESALALDPENEDTKHNKEEVERLLKKLKELLNQNNQSDNNQNNQDQQENEDNQDQQKNQDNQDQQQNNDNQNQQQNQQQNDSSQQDQQNSGSQDQQQDQQNSQDQQGQNQQSPQQQDQQDQEKDQGSGEQPKPEEQQPEEQQGKAEPKPEKGQAGQQPAQNQPKPQEDELQKQEALRLLDSLKNEDGDFKELYFKLQNPEEKDETKKDW